MDYIEKMDVCECRNITYMIKIHYANKGEKLQPLLEKIIVKQVNKDMLE